MQEADAGGTEFEYWANPSKPGEGFASWAPNYKQNIRLGADALGPYQGEGGSGVWCRLIPEKPMSIILNAGIYNMLYPPSLSLSPPLSMAVMTLIACAQAIGRRST